MSKLYINTDVELLLSPIEGFTMSDVVSASITFRLIDSDISLTVTPVLGVSAMIANIPDTAGISTPGIYTLRVTFVDSDGNIRGLTPDPEYLIFYE